MEASLIKAQVTSETQSTNHEVVAQYLDVLPLGYSLSFFGTKYNITVKTPLQHELSKHMIPKPKLDLTKLILSPMPGTVISINVKDGDVVAEGSEVAIVEAMKMQNVLRAPRAGVIKKVHVVAGQSVAGEEILVEFKDEKSK